MTYHPYSNSTGGSIIHDHGKPGGGGHTEGQGNVIILQNIHVGHNSSFISLYSFFFGSPHTAFSLFWSTDIDMAEAIREDMPRLNKYGENKKGKKI